MSLEACPECFKEVSHDAEVCPHCGAPRRPQKKVGLGILFQLSVLVLALYFTLPLLRDAYWEWRMAEAEWAARAAEMQEQAPGKTRSKSRARKAYRPVLACGSPDVQRGLSQLWRGEVARALSAKMGHLGDPIDTARASAEKMKLGFSTFQEQFRDPSTGTLHCTAVVTVSEGAGFRPSVSDVSYSAILGDGGRALEVTLVYVQLPPL